MFSKDTIAMNFKMERSCKADQWPSIISCSSLAETATCISIPIACHPRHQCHRSLLLRDAKNGQLGDSARANFRRITLILDLRLCKVVYDSWNYILDIYQMQMEDMRAWWPTWDLWLCQLGHNSWNIFDSYQMQFKDKINNGYFLGGIWQLELQLSHASGGYEGMLTFWELMI